MSFFDDASLVFLPSGEAGKDGKAYSMKPTDGSGDFTFSRGSNLTATRVDSNGLIEKGRENLLLQSNQFDTTWAKTNVILTSGQNGYDGSTDAWKLEADSDGSGRRINQSITQSGVFVFSVYVKAGTTDFIRLNLNGAGNCFFNISESSPSVLTSSNVNLVGSIQAIGDGWNRCSLLNLTGSSITEVRINLASGDNDLSAVTGDNIYIQDAQLEQGLVATEYIESGATKGKAGILEHSPRFDYSGGASCPSLLLEPSRTNLIEYSEYFEGSGWTAQAGITLTPNTTETLSPEGLNNAYKVVSTDATKGFYISGLNVTNDAVRTIYLKGSAGGETIVFKDPSGFGTPSTKTLTTDWQRFEMATTNDGNTYQGLFIDDISVGTIYAYGAQMEEASYSSSYIPNHSGGSVTRDADSSTSGTISNVTEGVLFFEGSVLKNNNTIKLVEFNDGSLLNVIQLYYRDSSGTQPRVYAIAKEAGSQVYGYAYDIPSGRGEDTHKVAFRFEDNNFALFYNGTKVHSQTSGRISANGKNQLMYETSAGAIPFRGNVKQTLVFPTALSDVELTALTS